MLHQGSGRSAHYPLLRWISGIVLALSLNGQAVIRINSGGPAVTSVDGKVWSADQFFVGGAAFAATQGTTEPLGTVRYQSTSFSYVVPVAPGTYDVTLHFLEQWVTSPGQRVFDVRVNGSPFLANFDIFAKTGTQPTTETIRATTNVNQINITFATRVRNAMVSAIEVVEVPNQQVGMARARTEHWRVFHPALSFDFKTEFRPAEGYPVNIYLNGLHQSLGEDYFLRNTETWSDYFLPYFQNLDPNAPHPGFDMVTIQYWTLSPFQEDEVYR